MALTDNPMSIIVTGNVTIGASLEASIPSGEVTLAHGSTFTVPAGITVLRASFNQSGYLSLITYVGVTPNKSYMNFKATVGSVPYMCKTLTFWLPVSATVPAVTWTFPTGSAVYYPKGVAPTLTANANNIINVIAVVDDTGSFSIQVCDTVVLPYSG